MGKQKSPDLRGQIEALSQNDRIEVFWLDSYALFGWQKLDAIDSTETGLCSTCGYFVRASDQSLVVALNRGLAANMTSYGDIIFIPLASVTALNVL